MISNEDMLILLKHKINDVLENDETRRLLMKLVIETIQDLGSDYKYMYINDKQEWQQLKNKLEKMDMYF